MRSEHSIEAALVAMERPRTRFVSAVAELVGELGSVLVQDRDSELGHVQRTASSLGAFAAGRIAVDRFAVVLSPRPVLPPAALEAIGRARAALSGIVTGGPEPFVVTVGAREDVAGAVSGALARLGRAFGAARMAALARSGAYRSSEHASLLEELPFVRWNRKERDLAPPLVVRVEGARPRLSGLADLLDGGVRIGILALEAESPAPLALLVTPRVFVAQGSSIELIERLCASPAPGIAAILPGSASEFVHDPAGGPGLGQRLSVTRLAPFSGGESDFRAAEEQSHLALLAAAASGGSTNGGGSPPEDGHRDPAGLLASWLLRQASLPQPSSAGSEEP